MLLAGAEQIVLGSSARRQGREGVTHVPLKLTLPSCSTKPSGEASSQTEATCCRTVGGVLHSSQLTLPSPSALPLP